jgi:hypothetical protein
MDSIIHGQLAVVHAADGYHPAALVAIGSPYLGNEKGNLPTLTTFIDGVHRASILRQLIGWQCGSYQAPIRQFKTNLVLRKVAGNDRVETSILLPDLAAMIAIVEVIVFVSGGESRHG